MAMAMETFRYFLRSFHRPIPVRYSWSVFLHVRRIPHQNSQWLFWASVWFMLDSSRWHEPFGGYLFQVGEWILDLISEFAFFNLVICLSKVKELAIFRFSPCRLSTCWTTARWLTFFWMLIGCSLKPRQHFSWLLLESLTDSCNMRTPGTGHACRYGGSSFYGRWYGSNVHVIRGLTT